jgi:DNA-binding transcriptional LysR family regulator
MQAKLDWSDLTVLLAFGRTGTIADAASELSVDETTAARRLKRLEAALGTALVTRVSGKLQLTPPGKLALERARVMEAAAVELVLHHKSHQTLKGDVRITGLSYVLNEVLIPALPQLLGIYPGLTPRIQSENRNLDVVTGETDIALRAAAPTDRAATSLKLGVISFAAYRPRNRFHGVAAKRCSWVGPDESFVHIPEFRWLTENIPRDRIIMRSNANICNAAAVKAGLACAVLPVLVGDKDRDMVRMEMGVLLQREIWLLHRQEVQTDSPIGVCAAWIRRVFRDMAPQLSG